jgi:site-specific recombinase XerD
MKTIIHPTPQPPRLLDQVRSRIRSLHYALRTEEAYIDWIKRYIVFSGRRHPRELSAADVERFLSHLAVDRNVAASTQNQAKSALLFLYKEVLELELPWLDGVTQARAPKRLPLVLTRDEVERVLGNLRTDIHGLIASLLYGSGLRLLEALRMRVKDVEFSRGEILVREGKGFKDRVTMLPRSVAERLSAHLEAVRGQHRADLVAGHGEVYLPYALARSVTATCRRR